MEFLPQDQKKNAIWRFFSFFMTSTVLLEYENEVVGTVTSVPGLLERVVVVDFILNALKHAISDTQLKENHELRDVVFLSMCEHGQNVTDLSDKELVQNYDNLLKIGTIPNYYDLKLAAGLLQGRCLFLPDGTMTHVKRIFIKIGKLPLVLSVNDVDH
jgi:hypothetical protein